MHSIFSHTFSYTSPQLFSFNPASAFPILSKNTSSNLFTLIIFTLCWILPLNANSESLDTLFKNLKNASNEAEARSLEKQIWERWFESGNSQVDELMEAAMRKRNNYDFNGAIDILNQVIEIKPDYSEAWNQRATVYFHQENYRESLSDIAKTLELEPRHFGAMAGRAVIRIRQLKPALARQSVIEALKIHPYLRERSLFPDLQSL